MAKTVNPLIGFSLLACMPNPIIGTVWAFHIYEKRTNPGIYLDLALLWSYMIDLSNGSVNSVVYRYTNRQVRAFVIRCCRRNRVENQDTLP